MTSLARSKTKRLHSWLWDSHISPKNSKWLQENLDEMDSKVKAMFKLINEDADSFARKAEMYYKRRPELTKLIEDFYRAYRSLAEKYVHATKALKQAHQRMVESFPSQVPPADYSPAGSVDGDLPPSESSSVESFASQKGGAKRNGSSEIEFLNVRKGLKPIIEPNLPPVVSKVPGTGATNEPAFEEEFGDSFEKVRKLQEKISKLISDNESLVEQVNSETQNASKIQSEIQTLKAGQSKLRLEKEEAVKKLEECLQKVRHLEAELQKCKKLNDQLLMKANKSESADEICRILKEENETLQLKVSELEQKSSMQQEELTSKEEELEKFKICVEDEHLRFKEAEEVIGSLNKLHSEAQEKLKASSLEVENGLQMLNEMELKKQALEEDMRRVQEENENLKRETEVKIKQDELEKLNASLQNEITRSRQAEEALQSLEKMHAQSQEELQQLMSDMENKSHVLKNVEARKQSLEEELAKLKEEIEILNEQNHSSQAMINLLQDEILSLKESNQKLEMEARLHVEGKENLQKELYALKDEMSVLKQKHWELIGKMQALGLNEQTFQSSVKELQDGNLELEESCKRQEAEAMLLVEKLEKMEEASEKNKKLEISLLDANVEIDELREKVNALHVSYEALTQKHAVLISEKNSLVLKVGSITENMAKLLDNNTFLENSVSDANYEFEELRGKMKVLEESSQALQKDNSNLQSENSILLSQVDLIGRSLESLEKKYSELHEKHANLEEEKSSTQKMLEEFSETSKVEKREHEEFKYSTIARLAFLERQIQSLHEDGAKREDKHKEDQFKLLAAQLENFILGQSLCDLQHGNNSLAKEHHKLEKHIVGQEGKMLLLLELLGRMRKGMYNVLNALLSNENFEFSDAVEESCWQFILNKVKEIQNSIHETEDEKLRLEIEDSVNATIISQIGSEIEELKSTTSSLETDCQKRTEELLFLQAEKSNLIGMNEQLKQDLQAGSEREEALEKEMGTLGKQLSHLKEVHSVSQEENFKLLQERELLSTELNNLKAEKTLLAEETRALMQEFVNVDCLSVIFENFSVERASELKTLIRELKFSHENNGDLQKEIQVMNEKIRVVEEENFKLKEYVLKSEECKSHLTVSSVEETIVKDVNDELNAHIERLNEQCKKEGVLLQIRDQQLADAYAIIADLENKDKELHDRLMKTLAEAEEAKSKRDELQKQVFSLSSEMTIRDKDIAGASETNEILRREVLKLCKENESLKAKEEQRTANLLLDVERCENEVSVLCSDLQEATAHVSCFEDKIHELMGVCDKLEIKGMVERTTLSEEISRRNEHIEKLSGKLSGKLKSERNEYSLLIKSLWNVISDLETHINSSEKYDEMDRIKASSETTSYEHGRKSEDVSKEHSTVSKGVLELEALLEKVMAIREALMQSRGQLEPEANLSHGGEQFTVKDVKLNLSSSSSKTDDDIPKIDNTFNPSQSDAASSGFISMRDLGLEDKLDVPIKAKHPDQHWTHEATEKLETDSRRLIMLEKNMEELTNKIEQSEKGNQPKSDEYDSVRQKLQETNKDILLLTKLNKKLTKTAEECPTSDESNGVESDDMANLRKKVLGRTRKSSEKIGRVEMELQKIQYILVKLEEERNSQSKSSPRRKVLLRDYLYGKGGNNNRKKSFLSWCTRPQAEK